jgi:hypothetical protein
MIIWSWINFQDSLPKLQGNLQDTGRFVRILIDVTTDEKEYPGFKLRKGAFGRIAAVKSENGELKYVMFFTDTLGKRLTIVVSVTLSSKMIECL